MTQDMSAKLGALRTIQTEELGLMLSWRNAPSVRGNMYTRHEISLEEHLAWWDKIQVRSDQKYFMYEFQGRPIGIVAFNGINLSDGNSSWAFYASPDAPKGTGSKMEFLALEHAFEVIGLHKLCCEVLAFNKPVISLHEKFGFTVEGVLREQHRLDDSFVDIYRLGILDHEWKAKRDVMLNKLLDLAK